ncbi:MAG: serine hydrolase domain-containing protein, partial [Bacteroidota bacterium]
AHLSKNPEQPVANILVYLENEKADFVYNKGFGQRSVSDTTSVQKDSPFKTASITKMLTSTLILQLVEEGKFKLSDPVITLIGDIDFVGFEKLMTINDKNYGSEITVGQLLNHTSGLADIFTDTQEEFMGLFFENPQKRWTHQDLFELYYRFNLNHRAHFKPGKGFYYSDTNYFLLGLVIEKYRALTLAEAYRTYILEPAMMKNTYFEYHENSTNELSFPCSYMGNIEINKDINTSFDWAGGGLVSTTYDLSLFMKALFSKTLIKTDSLLKEMITDSKDKYGYGMFLYNFDGTRFYGHSGFWGSDVFYNPEEGITMVISVNQTHLPYSHKEFVRAIYDLIK